MTYPTPASSIPQTHSEIEMENQRSPRATSNSASSSSTAVDSNNSSSNIPYDVFINHRGEVKKTFASHLYHRLLSRGLRPFLDQQELQEGLDFPSQLERAIRSASVHVAILSPKYAESRWCLDELLLMLESRKPIIPVFYHVQPAQLRWTDPSKNEVYALALRQLQMKKTYDSQTQQEKSRYESATIQNWRDALSKVADISGFDLDGTFNGEEGHMLEKIVERVVKLSKKGELPVARYPTGLNDKVTDFEAAVLKQQKQHTGKVQVVGIVGLGGLGKTTLALELFNRKRSEYNKAYFLSDVRENAKKSSLHSLQRVLLKGLGVADLDLDINNIYEGKRMFERHLKFSQVLLILDDIGHEDELEALLPVKDVLRSDSLILITSRNRDVLERSGLEQLCIYKLTGLTRQHSQELFCSYAFCQAYPLQGFEDLVDQCLKVCDGLPLSLKVFGALLFGKNDKSQWEAIIYQLEVPAKIDERLKISYDALSGEEKQIFLDIACFLIGEKKSSVIGVWDGSKGLLGFEKLECRCLVEVDDENVIHMHDHLRDLGRDIAGGELPRRLWHHTGNIEEWLHKQSSVIPEARGISIKGTSSQQLSLYQRSCHQLLGNCVMKLNNRLYNTRDRFPGIGAANLQILETEGHFLERILKMHSPNLLWLSWHDYPYNYLPSWIPMKNLRVLKVGGRVLKTLWQGKSQVPLQLQELEIHADGLSSIPKSIGQLKHLERIVMFCSCLAKLPEEFGHVKSLRALVLRASFLKSLPESLGKLTNLHHVDLSKCSKLERLPDSFGSLTNLYHLELRVCSKLERLPDSFGSLTNLHHLDLSCCYKLERLPDSFGSLTNLHHVDLSECSKLERLPDSFGSLTNVYHLELSYDKLERLPDSFGSLTNLYHLELLVCSKLERLPDSFGSLTNLHHLALRCCDKLERLPDSFGSLTNLHHLYLRYCDKLERLPDSFGSLTNLHHLDLHYCDKLERLPDSFGSLTNLHHLDFHCSKLERLPDSFGSLTNLHHLELSFCQKLERLPDSFGSLTNLHHVDLSYCRKLERLPDSLGSFSSLKYLDASGCSNLSISSDTLGNIRTLEHIDLSGCEKIEVWPSQLAHQRSLKILKLTGTNFKELPSAIEVPSDLEVLWFGSSLLDTLLPLLGDLRKLKELRFQDCRELKCLPASVGQLSQLTKLEVVGCPVIELPFKKVESDSSIHENTEISEVLFDEGVCPNLQALELNECINLVVVGTLPNTLTYVKLWSCYNLRSIEGLCGLAMLRRLWIEKCSELQELPTVKTWVSLETLCTFDCVKLKSIRDLAQLTKLWGLVVHRCPELEELEGVEYCESLDYLSVSGCPKLRLGKRVVKRLRQKGVEVDVSRP